MTRHRGYEPPCHCHHIEDELAAIRRQLERIESKEGKIMSAETDTVAALAAFTAFLADLAAILPAIQTALSGADNVDPATVQGLDALVTQVAPLQAQYDALVPPASA